MSREQWTGKGGGEITSEMTELTFGVLFAGLKQKFRFSKARLRGPQQGKIYDANGRLSCRFAMRDGNPQQVITTNSVPNAEEYGDMVMQRRFLIRERGDIRVARDIVSEGAEARIDDPLPDWSTFVPVTARDVEAFAEACDFAREIGFRNETRPGLIGRVATLLR